MTRPRNDFDFKNTQVFGWEAEPKDERPSEFVPSTGFSSLSGYYSMPPDASVMRRRRTATRGGGGTVLWLSAALVIALGAVAMLAFLYYVKR